MQFPDSFFEDEVRDGFFVPGLMKRAWAAQMEVLADIDKVCKKYNIRWFADRGTLLGAVRHKGYIPWDDDLDICMLRDDYIRFNAIAEKELPKGYHIPKEREADHRMLTTVFNSSVSSFDQEHLKKFHGFPMCAAVDIFPLDYIAPDPEDEEFRINLAEILITVALAVNDEKTTPEDMESMLSQVEELLQVKLRRDEPLQEQLFALTEHVFSLYTADEATEVACMPNWVMGRSWKFPLECYKEAVMLPFECIQIAVPKLYLEAVKLQFGENYMQPYRAGGGHEYPAYQRMEQIVLESSRAATDPLSHYFFSKEDLQRPLWKGGDTRPEKVSRDFVHLADNIHKQIFYAIENGDFPSAVQLLAACQNSAIRIGTMLEESIGQGLITVRMLEEYCEQLYLVHELLIRQSPDTEPYSSQKTDSALSLTDWDALHVSLKKQMERIDDSISAHIHDRKEIVFLPFKAAAWKSLEPLWEKARANPDYDVFVIPVPYYYKSLTEQSPELHYEGDEFPDYIPITDYNAYDFDTHLPDAIVIHNPYDNCSFTTSVHPFFYSSNLKQYTGQLVYTPYFQTDEIEPDDTRSIYNMRYYVAMPALVHADKTLLPTRQTRRAYIDYLTAFAGEDTRAIWEEKITLLHDFTI